MPFFYMKTFTFDKTYFNVDDTLTCGQFFTYEKHGNGYLVRSLDKFCYAETTDEFSKITCNDDDISYFSTFFDLERDYAAVCNKALSYDIPFLNKCVSCGKGIRILRQDEYENLISFIISQNNNIPRIKKSIAFLCEKLGRDVLFDGKIYKAFPTAQVLASQSEEFFKRAGLGYRAPYLKIAAEKIVGGELNLKSLSTLPTQKIKENLLKIKGVGEKVASCVILFAYGRFDSFPVDTWIEKIYRENFGGTLTERKKISQFFIEKFGDESGIIQQYVFHYKRNLEK